MEPVGQLDQDDPDVVGHCQEHLSNVLGLLLLMAVGAELGQLGDAVHELRHLGPEALLDLGQGHVGILGDVVQDRGSDRHRIDADIGQDLSRGQRVVDIGLARHPGLAVMGHLGHLERGPQRRQIGLRIVVGYRVSNVSEPRLRIRQDGQSKTQPIRQRQTCRPASRFGLPDLGGWSRRFNRHRSESTSRVRPDPPRGPDYSPRSTCRSIVPASVTELAPTATELSWNGLP